MSRAELKKQAKECLRGRWGTAIAMVVMYEIIAGALSMIGNFVIGLGAIAVLVISIPISFGFIGQFIKFSRKEEVGVVDFFKIGFDNFGKSWSIFGNTLLKLLPYVIGMIVSMVLMIAATAYATQKEDVEMLLILILIAYVIFFVFYIMLLVKSYLYMLPEYIGNDTDDMTAKEIVEKSAELMKGHRWEFFVLQLSFLGWIFLSLFTCGIGLLWVIPYMDVTIVKFYEYVAGVNKGSNSEVIDYN